MRRVFGVGLAACCAWLSVSGCTCGERDRARGSRAALPPVSDRAAVLAELPEPAGAAERAAPTALAEGQEFVFAARGGGVAWVAGANGSFRVVHNGRAGKTYAEVGAVILSPDGKRCAHAALADGKWRIVVDGREGASFDAVDSPVFSPDGSRLAYQARAGESWHVVVDGTAGGGAPTPYLDLGFGASTSVVFIAEPDAEGWGKLVVADVALEKQTTLDARVSSALRNADRTRVAAIAAADGQQQVLTFAVDRPDQVTRGPRYDAIYAVDFGPDGASLTYLAERSGERIVVLNDKEAPLPDGEDPIAVPVVRPGTAGVGALVLFDGAVRLSQLLADAGRAEAGYEGAESLAYGPDGRSHAFAARRGERWFVVASGKEGPPFDRVVDPRFSPDGEHLVYRAREDGKRFVVIADREGKTIRRLAEYEQVFPVHFTADGRSIAYGVKDGRQLAWKVEPL